MRINSDDTKMFSVKHTSAIIHLEHDIERLQNILLHVLRRYHGYCQRRYYTQTLKLKKVPQSTHVISVCFLLLKYNTESLQRGQVTDSCLSKGHFVHFYF